MEENISMPELLAIIDAKRKSEHNEQRFFAAIQGIDLDKNAGEDAWEAMKNRVFNSGSNQNDITSLQGLNAQAQGFGIGFGLDYEVIE